MNRVSMSTAVTAAPLLTIHSTNEPPPAPTRDIANRTRARLRQAATDYPGPTTLRCWRAVLVPSRSATVEVIALLFFHDFLQIVETN